MNASPASAAVGLAGPEPVPYGYVARQPIFTADEKVFGYELLFRDGVEDYFREKDVDAASRHALDKSLQIDLQTLCGGKRAFVNCTRDVLLKDYITLFPSPYTVVEVLESVPPDDLVKAALERRKQAGYMIALDDFTIDDPRAAFADLADILKIDMQATTAEDRATLVSRYGPGSAACWLKGLKPANIWNISRSPKRLVLFTSKAVFSASRKQCMRKKYRQPPQLHAPVAGCFETG